MQKVSIERIRPNPLNAEIFDDHPDEKLLGYMDTHGWLKEKPAILKPDFTLLDGHRRFKAAKKVGVEKVPCIIDSTEFESEEDEKYRIALLNLYRKLNFSEKMRMAEILEPKEKEKAKKRQGERTDKHSPNDSGNVGETADIVGQKLGIGKADTYRKAKKVWDKAKKGDKDAKREVKKIDQEKSTISSAYRKIERKEREKERDPPEIPNGKYSVILADPPWRYDFSLSESRSIENQYPTMPLKDIMNLKIPSAQNSVLYLWATAPKLQEALKVMKKWGFRYKTSAVWTKKSIGMGYWFRNQHEILLVGVKGEHSPPPPRMRNSSIITGDTARHSEKPRIHSLIEDWFPGESYLELFARKKRENWTTWGDEVED